MSEEDAINSEITRLEKALRNVEAEQGYAKREREKVKSTFSGVRKWKGSVWDSVKNLDVQGAYDSWIWRWGWSDDGSINGVADRLNDEIGEREGLLEQIWANLENLVN